MVRGSQFFFSPTKDNLATRIQVLSFLRQPVEKLLNRNDLNAAISQSLNQIPVTLEVIIT